MSYEAVQEKFSQSRLKAMIRKLPSTRMADALAVLGLVVYFVQSLIYAHQMLSLIDEGMYVFKGYFFAIGRYWPYQEYGFWTNHMPLSFLIPGYAQALFGPGIRTARFFAVFQGTLTITAVWLTARRLSGNWWGAFATWTLALNPLLIKTYSLGLSQGVVAVLLSWSLFFVLGRERARWHIILGSVLAGMVLLTRINMFIVLPILIGYVFWQHGWRKGMIALFAGFGAVVLVHVIYWPGIMRMWDIWTQAGAKLISAFFSFLGFESADAARIQVVDNDYQKLIDQFKASFLGVRENYLAMTAAFAATLLWSPQRNWKDRSAFRTSTALLVLFYPLLALHIWAAIGGKTCEFFCFPHYLQFFYVVGILALVSSVESWRYALPVWRKAAVILFTIVYLAGIGFSAFREIGIPLGAISVPRLSGGAVESGLVELWGLPANKFGLPYLTVIHIIATLAGFLAGTFLTTLIVPLMLRYSRKKWAIDWPYGSVILAILLGFGLIFSPFPLLSGSAHTHDCSGNVIAAYEKAGTQLAGVLEPEAQIFWQSESAMILLYAPDVRIYPPQINDIFGFKDLPSEMSDELLRVGQWNRMLQIQWAQEADYVLVEGRHYRSWDEELVAGYYDIVEITSPMEPCRGENAQLFVLKNMNK
jgi:hypothetical protein